MSTQELRLELHRIIDKIKDSNLLNAVYTLLVSHKEDRHYSIEGKSLLKKEIDSMIEASENDIQSGNTTDHYTLKEEIKSWRKK